LLFDQVATLPVALLGASAVLSVATGGIADAIAILAVVGLNTAIGYVTERDAERTIRSLGRTAEGAAVVMRDGALRRLPAEDIVPGDLLFLGPGTAIPADARVTAVDELAVDESPLTGESVPVSKSPETLTTAAVALAERCNMVFKGTSVVSGQGQAIAVATGAATEVGRIEILAGVAEPPQTPLQRQLDRMGRHLVWASLAACGFTLVLGLLRGQGTLAMVKSSISLAVAAVPEGLPTVATVTLALGIREMRRHQAVVRRLQAVETLGSVTVVCFDKTGTLTQNRMRAVRVHLAGSAGEFGDPGDRAAALLDADGASDLASHPVGRQLLQVCALCSEATATRGEDGEIQFAGTATEQALLRLAIDHGLDVESLRTGYPLLHTRYRTPGHNHMVTRHRSPSGGEFTAIKGNPEEVLALCHAEAIDDGSQPLSHEREARILAANRALAAEGCRVLGFACSDGAPTVNWLGLVGMADPIRPNLASLMRQFHEAGIRTVLITGDQSATAYSVARALDLSGGEAIEILEGLRLEATEPELFDSLARRTQVFARATPANKLAIVRALQRQGDAVAMTGDGINDGPALRAADIGVTLGSAAHIAHQLADLVLADDRLETMAVAVSQGRTIYRNIRKAIHFLLATNLSEILVMLAATGISLGPSLTPAQLLWINLLSDVFPGLALAVDPPDPDVLAVPPRPTGAPIFDRKDFFWMGAEGAVIAVAGLAAAKLGPDGGRGTVAGGRGFLALTVAQLLHALSGRSETETLFDRTGRPPNRRLDLAVALLIAVQLGALALPPLRRLLGLQGLRLADLAVVGAADMAAFAANQGLKKVRGTGGRFLHPSTERGQP
jgi:Ca2+-transporting ATPase